MARRRAQGRKALLRVLGVGLACLGGVALCACGSASRGPVVASVDGGAIHARAVEHWGGVLARGGIVMGASRLAGGSPRARAVGFLVASRWLAGQASEQGLRIPESDVQSRLEELKQAVPGGDSAFADSLHGAGETVADVELEIKTELARSSLRQALAARPSAVEEGEVERYYRENRARYLVPEHRQIDIVENLTSPAAARALARRIGTGPRLARIAYHENVERPRNYSTNGDKAAVERAIFSAKVGVLYGPMRLNHAYTLFVLRRVIPAAVKPLPRVRGAIVARLTARARKRALEAFTASYRSKWSARTSCRSGYVVPGCRQYAGSGVPDGPFGEG